MEWRLNLKNMDSLVSYQNSKLISIYDYMDLLKLEINTDWKMSRNCFVNRIREYGIEAKLIHPNKPLAVDIETLPILTNKILSEIEVFNDSKENRYSISQTTFKAGELDNFIEVEDIENIAKQNYGVEIPKYTIRGNLSKISIPFISKKRKFYQREIALEFIKKYAEENILMVDMNERVEILKEKLPSIFSIGTLKPETLQKKIKTKYTHIKPMTHPVFKIYKTDIDVLIQSIIDDIEVVNVTPENDTCNLGEYNISKKDITIDFINNCVGKSYYDENVSDKAKMILLTRKLPYIKSDLVRDGFLFRRECIDFIKYLHDNCVPIRDVIQDINKKLNTNFTYNFTVKRIKQSNTMKLFSAIPSYSDKIKVAVLKDDIYKIEQIFKEKREVIDDGDLCERMEKYIKLNGNLTHLKVRKTLDLYKIYVISVNDKTSDRYISTKFRECSQVYDMLTTLLKKDLLLYTDEEVEELMILIDDEGYTVNAIERFRLFFNHLMRTTKQRHRIIRRVRNEEKVLPYELEDYFATLGYAMSFMQDKKKIIDKLIESTGARARACSLLCLISHYTACWRICDLIDNMPNINLNLIGFESGKEFIEWFKKEDSVFTEKMGKLICTTVESYIEATKAVASKNGGELLLYVSKFLYPTYGLLLCICEEHRQRVNADRLLVKTCASRMGEHIQEVDENIMEPIGRFGNRRANKSFETYISEKSEEWNLGLGNLMGAIARGHKLTKRHFSETTVIYMNKDVEVLSYRAFSSGIFSIAKHKFLSLIDDEYEEKPIAEKAIIASEFHMTNYEIETVIQSVVMKKHEIDKFFKTYLTTKEIKKGTARKLIFGKESISKHENAKCLWRAYESAKNEGEIDLSQGFLKSCPYMTKDSCIGCSMLVAEVYFLYEFEERLTGILERLERATSDFDKQIHIDMLQRFYFPILYEAIAELGAKRVKEIVSVDKMSTLYRKAKESLKIKNKEGKINVISN